MYTLLVHAHPRGKSWKEIRASVRTANGLQSYFQFSLVELTKPLSRKTERVKIKAIEKTLARRTPAVSGLIFCEESFDGALVQEFLPERIYVSSQVSKGRKSPPFRLYLLYQLAAAALTLGASLTRKTNEQMIHRRRPVGCLWDWWEEAGQRATAMMVARICPRCQSDLRKHGNDLPEEAIVAARQILDYVRRSMLGEAPAVANRVFIAYGSAPDWKVLKSMLTHWGLDVEYFSRQVVTEMIAERWKQMIDQSRFAFALMTPDDTLADGTHLARQNVVHEIGLCHSRIGLRNTAILLADGTQKFTNVDGVNYIPFTVGKLQATAPTIHQLLKERGILDSDHTLTLPADTLSQ
jgi:hypothetical protein